jgi:hypothetical protein
LGSEAAALEGTQDGGAVSGFAKPCSICGRRSLPGTNRCARHPKPVMSEAERTARYPYRRNYFSAEYRRASQERYRLCGGRCEACGAPLESGWECHHTRPVRDRGSNLVTELRCLCIDCHKKATLAGRRARSEKEQP